MRFMATKSVNEGRKAATFNIIAMLPLSAIVVGNAGWIGKAISITNPEIVPPNTAPDQIFVVVANIVSSPGVFGFIMAALTAALMSTVDTLINATAAIFINDVYRPVKEFMKPKVITSKETDRRELNAARWSSVGITILGVLAVLALDRFPTVYEAHGYFHSTLTPPLVVAIFMGIFWRKFTPAAVMSTFIAGVSLMMLGAANPEILIAPFDHGIELNTSHPYSYIRALYNLLVCTGVGVLVAFTTQYQKDIVAKLKQNENHKNIFIGLIVIAVINFIVIALGIAPVYVSVILSLILLITVALTVTHYVKYDEQTNLEGLTVWTINRAKEFFKGSKVNEDEGEIVSVSWKAKDGEEDTINVSKKEMELMKANVGDLVYLCDSRKYLGGLKSIHSAFGEPHDEDGIVYINNEHLLSGVFIKDKLLTAEKEM